tara:strand:- start:154 stop:501 length:348 start_codon:yes stop_codon:yes gene_type:complete
MTAEIAINAAKEAHKLAGQAHQKAEIALVRHDEHEKVCATRYTEILSVHNTTQAVVRELHDNTENTFEAMRKASAKKSDTVIKYVLGVAGVIIIGLIAAMYRLIEHAILFPNLTS